MNKRFLLASVLLLAVGGLCWFLLGWYAETPVYQPGPSEQQILQDLKRRHPELAAEYEPQQVPVRNPADPVRLAIGGLGLADEAGSRQLGDLIAAQLSGAKGLDLVERTELDRVLREQAMNLAGLVRAKDAVRIGKLVRSDWFLLGNEHAVGGTNLIVARIVDARTGILLHLGLVQLGNGTVATATALATLVRECLQPAVAAKPHVFLALGGFANVGVNNRQIEVPAQLRAFLTGAYRQSNVTLLEREAANLLLQEVRLDLAGLTDESSGHPSTRMQAACWLVDGFYQSVAGTVPEVELAVHVQSAFGPRETFNLRGPPDVALFQRIKSFIDEQMAKVSPVSLAPTRRREIASQLSLGKDCLVVAWRGPIDYCYSSSEFDRRCDLRHIPMVDYACFHPAQEADHLRRRHNVEQAIQAFQTVLLLDHDNLEAKLLLGACLADVSIKRPDEARAYFQELIDYLPKDDRPKDAWSREDWVKAAWSRMGQIMVNRLNWWYFGIAPPDEPVGTGSKQSAQAPSPADQAEKRLFESIPKNSFLAVRSYVQSFGQNTKAPAERLVQLWPRLKSEFPDRSHALLATILSYQADTNSPVVSEFRQLLASYREHPEQLAKPIEDYFGEIELIDCYQWAMNKRAYLLALETVQSQAQSSLRFPNHAFDSTSKIRLGFAYMALERWREALAVFEEFGEHRVDMVWHGPWRHGPWWNGGIIVRPAEAAALCRTKLGLAPAQSTPQFAFGPPCLDLFDPSTFLVDRDSIWVGCGGKLLQLGFDLATNAQINLPIEPDVPITALWSGPAQIWIGTLGAGLIECDKATRKCRRLDERDGLLRNDLSCLHQCNTTLWIGFGSDGPGGLGRLDLATGRAAAFTAPLGSNPLGQIGWNPSQSTDPVNGPPNHTVTALASGPADELWMIVARHGLQRYRPNSASWDRPKTDLAGDVISLTSGSGRLVIGLRLEELIVSIRSRRATRLDQGQIPSTNHVLTAIELKQLFADTNYSGRIGGSRGGELKDKGSLAICDIRSASWLSGIENLRLPGPPTRLEIAGTDVWAAGQGYVAVVDTASKTIRKICYNTSDPVNQIQVAGGYLWAQFGEHLYRVPLTVLQ